MESKQQLIAQVKDLAKELYPKIQGFRHHLHAYPELSFQEINTSAYIKEILTKEGIAYTENWAGTGILATIKGNKEGVRRAFRADIDALPIKEENRVSYVSKTEGLMHACGHDVHTSSMLGTILIINQLKDQLKGQIVFVFQPGEEKHPGGASILLKEKIFGDTMPSYLLGQHVYPSMQVGKVGIRSGQYMASADELYFTIKGKGGHAATPHQAVDTILVASYIVTALQQLISRNRNPTYPSVLTIGKINSTGGATNIIPEEVKMEGTFRAMDEAWRYEAHSLIKRLCEGLAASMGAICEVEILVGYPSLINDEQLTAKIKTNMIDYLGDENVEELPLRLTSEDFAYYTQVMPSCFYRLGTGNVDKGITSPVHTSTFDIDEEALEIGAGLGAYLLLVD
jgi:hippurate hydrolase